MIEKEGRKDYQSADEPSCILVDKQRAANEIALVNNITGEVEYGITGLIRVFSNSYVWLRPILSIPPVLWVLKIIYAFIAFNRRVIVPPYKVASPFAIQPQFKLNYRLAYIIVTTLLCGWIFNQYYKLILPLREGRIDGGGFLFVTGLIVVQSVIALMVAPKKTWDYLGNMMTINTAAALLLLPVFIISIWVQLSYVFYIIFSIVIIALMFVEHLRRMRVYDKGWVFNTSWLLYYSVTFILMVMEVDV